MSAMKVTTSAAMRARDVSRPRPEQLADAEAAEARYPGGPGGRAAGPAPSDRPPSGRPRGRAGDTAPEAQDNTDGAAGLEKARAGGGATRGEQDENGRRSGGATRGEQDENGRRRRRITRAGKGRHSR